MSKVGITVRLMCAESNISSLSLSENIRIAEIQIKNGEYGRRTKIE